MTPMPKQHKVSFTLQTNDPNAQAAQLANITQDTAGLDAAEIAVTSVLLGDLSTEAVNNSQVRMCYNIIHLVKLGFLCR